MDGYDVSNINLHLKCLTRSNIAPFLNSDGYKTLITLLDMDEFTDRKENSKFIKIIQLLSILMVLHTVFNWILFYL